MQKNTQEINANTDDEIDKSIQVIVNSDCQSCGQVTKADENDTKIPIDDADKKFMGKLLDDN